MSAPSMTARANANIGTDHSDSRSCPNGQFTAAVMRKAHDLFHSKIAEEIAFRTKKALRTAYRWKSGKRSMEIEDYLALLQGEEAVEFLKVFWDRVPEAARERWINQELLSRRIKAAEDKALASKREIEQLRSEFNNR